MAKRLGKFELPNRLVKVEETATPTYAQFIVNPFEIGYGHTIGNALRRVLLNSIEGAAIAAIKIEGAHHEFQCIDGVKEDVTDIVLNLKKVLLKTSKRESLSLFIEKNKEGLITAADIQGDPEIEIVNPKQPICTLEKNKKFYAQLGVLVGRGYRSAELNKRENQAIGVIPIDCLFSPVRMVRYSVENTRVGQMTDFDKMILDIWTDGRITPEDALKEATSILMHHFKIFQKVNEEVIEFEGETKQVEESNNRLHNLLNMSVNEIELTVRAANCLNNANILTVGQLVLKNENEMLKYRNFGKKSLTEIKGKLQELGLSLGMKIDERLLTYQSSGTGQQSEKPLNSLF